MAITYDLYKSRHLLVTKLEDIVCYDEFYNTYKAILTDTSEWPEIFEISLIPTSVEIRITPQGLRDLAERLASALAERNTHLKTAFIAPSDTSYGLASVYRAQAAYSGRIEINILRAAPDAFGWLGIDSALMEAILPKEFA